MTKFDEGKLKLRRAFSLEAIQEEVSWNASDDENKRGDGSDEYEDLAIKKVFIPSDSEDSGGCAQSPVQYYPPGDQERSKRTTPGQCIC